MKKRLSLFLRIFLWIVLLGGGAFVSLWNDTRVFAHLFHSLWWHIATLPIAFTLGFFAFHTAAVGGRTLARHGRASHDLPRLETDRLVKEGIYSKMRHPMLLGLALLPLALAFLLGSPTFILFVAPLEMLLIVGLSLTLEEWECRAKFGSAYESYAKEVPPICLKRSCLKALFWD